MDLIKKMDEERLNSCDYSGGNADWNITLRSLRAALEERDSWKRDSESLRKEIQRWYDKLQASDSDLDAALSREAGLQRQLCRLRESVYSTKSFDTDTPGYGPCWCDTFYEAQEKGPIAECKILNAALSSPSRSCPHEAEVARMTDYADRIHATTGIEITNLNTRIGRLKS